MTGYIKKASKLVNLELHRGDRFQMGFRAAFYSSVLELFLSVCPSVLSACLLKKKHPSCESHASAKLSGYNDKTAVYFHMLMIAFVPSFQFNYCNTPITTFEFRVFLAPA